MNDIATVERIKDPHPRCGPYAFPVRGVYPERGRRAQGFGSGQTLAGGHPPRVAALREIIFGACGSDIELMDVIVAQDF